MRRRHSDGFIIRLTHNTVLTVNLYETADGAYSAWHNVVSQPEYGAAGELEAGNYDSWISSLNWGRAIDPSVPRVRPAEPRLRSVPRAAGPTQ